MLALIASGAVVAYILIPGILYRLTYSLFIPPKNFQRTRTEEIAYAAKVGAVPFVLALFLRLGVPWTNQHPFPVQQPVSPSRAAGQPVSGISSGAVAGSGVLKPKAQADEDSCLAATNDYRRVFGGAYSERLFEADPSCFWQALNRVARRQAGFLSWFYILLVGAAVCFGWASRNLWWWLSRGRFRSWVAEHILAPQISEWYLMLRPPPFEGSVCLDLLTSGQLYRGMYVSHDVDRDGHLTGLFLTKTARFERQRYEQDIQVREAPVSSDEVQRARLLTESYWKEIPGEKVYFPYDKVVNLNVRWEPTSSSVNEALKKLGIEGVVEEPSERKRGSTSADV